MSRAFTSNALGPSFIDRVHDWVQEALRNALGRMGSVSVRYPKVFLKIIYKPVGCIRPWGWARGQGCMLVVVSVTHVIYVIHVIVIKVSVLASIVVIVAGASGLALTEMETRTERLFVPTRVEGYRGHNACTSPPELGHLHCCTSFLPYVKPAAMADYSRSKELFGKDPRMETFTIQARGHSVVQKPQLLEALRIFNFVVYNLTANVDGKIVRFSDICYRPISGGPCATKSVFEVICGNSMSTLQNMTQTEIDQKIVAYRTCTQSDCNPNPIHSPRIRKTDHNNNPNPNPNPDPDPTIVASRHYTQSTLSSTATVTALRFWALVTPLDDDRQVRILGL